MNKDKFLIIFGLTADPIHLGHEQAIINGIDYCRSNGIYIEQFLLMPVYQPNLIGNKNAPVVSYEHRFSMCEMVAERLSIQLDCVIKVSHIEKELAERTGEKNYSFNTIRALNIDASSINEWIPAFAGMTEEETGMTEKETGLMDQVAGMTNLLFMVSADHFGGRWPKFRKWYKWREILRYSGLLINQRSGNRINDSFIRELRQINSEVFVVQNSDVIDVSSSRIRRQLGANQAVELLAPDVLNYIKEHSLY